jgi:hypothetical protein
MNILILLLLFLLSCGKNNVESTTSNKNILRSISLNGNNCVNCVSISFSARSLMLVMDNNTFDTICVGTHIISLDSDFSLPALGSQNNYGIINNSNSACSIDYANNLHVINNNNVYQFYVGAYQIDLKGVN